MQAGPEDRQAAVLEVEHVGKATRPEAGIRVMGDFGKNGKPDLAMRLAIE
jgi:hypothetical protein